jgi:hypothetical protein
MEGVSVTVCASLRASGVTGTSNDGGGPWLFSLLPVAAVLRTQPLATRTRSR